MNKRTVLDFRLQADPWFAIDTWALQSDYQFTQGSGLSRLYQKGTGFLVAPMMLQLQQTGDQMHLEAWIRGTLFARIGSLFILPAEMGIESGGFRGVLPRGMARGDINVLLNSLGQPPIT